LLLKESWLYIADNTNVCWIKIFHLYKGFKRKKSKPGYFVKGSSRIVEPPRLEYKGFKYKYSVKGDITRSWIIRSVKPLRNIDSTNISFNKNVGVLVFKKHNIKSKFVNGPLPTTLKIKKLYSLYNHVI
jgi:ribosomal protein L14